MQDIPSINLCSTGFRVGNLKVAKQLGELSEKEMQYAVNILLSQFAGLPILFDQTSPESQDICNFLVKFFSVNDVKELEKAKSGEPLFYFIEFAAQFFYNSGNYLGFGDYKIVPRCTPDDIRGFCKGNKELLGLCEKCINQIFDVADQKKRALGFYPDGCTTYYLPDNFTAEEAKAIDLILDDNKILNNNTRIIRHADRYEVSIASVDVDTGGRKIGDYNGKPVYLTKGRYSEYFKKVISYLEESLKHVANDTQKSMIESLIKHYKTGSVEDHIKYSEYWVKDIDPVVETHQGFIECYRDPKGCRCEFEGFVACVDKKESVALHKFVDASKKVLSLLPYPKAYERETFNPPSYNALCIISMVSSGYPIGINIPNYDEIRHHIGFKNVSLTNVMNAVKVAPEVLDILPDDARSLFIKHIDAVEVIAVAAHELYGHGSGKLFKKEDISAGIPDILHPGKMVKSFWPENLTYDVAFGTDSSAFEECRAEASSLFLSFFDEVLDIFDVSKDPKVRKEVKLVAVYSMLLGSLRSMYCYSKEASKWTQAHSRARFAILRAILMWSRNAVELKVDAANKKFQIIVDPECLSDVQDAVGNLLKHLNYYKSCCLPKQAHEFLGALTSMDDGWLIVKSISDSLPRKRSCFSQAIVVEKDGKRTIKDYTDKDEPTPLDCAMSYIHNYKVANGL